MELPDGPAGGEPSPRLKSEVESVMSVRSWQTGHGGDQSFAAYGALMVGAEAAFERLDPIFREEGVSLFLREAEGEQVILAVPGTIETAASNPLINLALFVATLISVVFSGALFANVHLYGADLAAQAPSSMQEVLGLLDGGIPFALSLLAILLAHEFGHYLAGRYHNTAVTLPYFLPLPGTILGTLGAFIRMQEPPKNRKVLLDIGLAGPLAGFFVAVPILLIGLSQSILTNLPTEQAAAGGLSLEGNSILYLLAKYAVKGELLPAPLSFEGVNPLLYWARYFFTGQPIPFGGLDVLVHPLAWAGWAGLLVTSLNLIPVGQLDGGHLLYVLMGRRARLAWPVAIVGLVLMGFVWSGWWLWAALIFLLGRTHARTRDEITDLDPRRRLLAIGGLLLFLVTFTPIPLFIFPGG